MEDLNQPLLEKDIKLEEQANEQIFGDDWTESSQNQIEEWRREAIENSSEHSEASSSWRRFGNRIKIPSLSLTALTTFLVGAEKYVHIPHFFLFTLAVSSLNVFAQSLMHHYNTDERVERHSEVSRAYTNLSRRLDYTLTLPIHKRPDVEVIFVQTTTEFESIDQRSPPL